MSLQGQLRSVTRGRKSLKDSLDRYKTDYERLRQQYTIASQGLIDVKAKAQMEADKGAPTSNWGIIEIVHQVTGINIKIEEVK